MLPFRIQCRSAFGSDPGILMISPLFLMALLTGAFGMIQAASGIAMTSETLSLITSENKSLSTGLWMTLYTGGTGLSGTSSANSSNSEFSVTNGVDGQSDKFMTDCCSSVEDDSAADGNTRSDSFDDSTQGGMDSTGLLKVWCFRRPQRPSLDHGNDG